MIWLLLLFSQFSMAEGWFTLSCRAELFGSQGSYLEPELVTKPFELTRQFLKASPCVLQLDPLTLSASINIGRPPGSEDFEPTVWIRLFHGSPTTGSINQVAVQGNALYRMAVGDDLNFMGMHHVLTQIGERHFSGLTYQCSLRRVR